MCKKWSEAANTLFLQILALVLWFLQIFPVSMFEKRFLHSCFRVKFAKYFWNRFFCRISQSENFRFDWENYYLKTTLLSKCWIKYPRFKKMVTRFSVIFRLRSDLFVFIFCSVICKFIHFLLWNLNLNFAWTIWGI